MIKSLTQYFAQNGQLILPNIGIIKCHKEDALWVNSILVAPKETIIFEATDSKPSKLFYHFLANNLDISYEQAIVQYEQFLDTVFKNDLPQFVLGNFGTLNKTEGLFHWTSNFQSTAYLKDIEISPIPHQDDVDSNKSTRKDRWYLWTILLAIISILLILFKSL